MAVADKARPHRALGTEQSAPFLRPYPFWAEGESGRWVVHWRLDNEGRPVHVKTALQPHSQFRTAETTIDRDIPSRGTLDLALPVRFDEKPGTVVENPFLILRVGDDGAEWRVLVRVRVTAGARGEPISANTLSITVDRVEAA